MLFRLISENAPYVVPVEAGHDPSSPSVPSEIRYGLWSRLSCSISR
jgi:hypothetical protein